MHILDSKHAWTSELYVVGDLGNEHCRWNTQNAIFDQKPLVVKEWRAGIWNVGTLGKNVFRVRRHRKGSPLLASFNEPSKLTETLLTRTDAHPDCICAARVLYFENIFISTNHFCVVDRKRQCQTVFGWHHSKRCYPNGGCRFICTIDCHFPLYKYNQFFFLVLRLVLLLLLQ